ncbi:MaoC family dehydratase N-terminal domain-containing protein [Paenalkalicoccus suaedae]|uniref:MaoC family dehydratase N-terminal domain-containing protein n=1 Tax=Paenalkalicoccus suaedae TaxID=2592382 RepID=A0A859FGW1_9BACI|nr:MaoC/PaaZ C-terminal domain-containing protein [Paenalkalicoccus suaedae]QKS72030.1 MaoC family dehydratase N-terminal domain-containing protein [Paenalkalicoccus suaedae]
MFSKRKTLGKTFKDCQVGDEFEQTIEIKDKDILLYLGFTDDANPIYIQHDYATRTPYKRPIVPQVMLHGMITKAVSMHLPGPGSVIMKESHSYDKPVYHYESVHLKLTLVEKREKEHQVVIRVEMRDQLEDVVISSELVVAPPYPWKSMTEEEGTFENF